MSCPLLRSYRTVSNIAYSPTFTFESIDHYRKQARCTRGKLVCSQLPSSIFPNSPTCLHTPSLPISPIYSDDTHHTSNLPLAPHKQPHHHILPLPRPNLPLQPPLLRGHVRGMALPAAGPAPRRDMVRLALPLRHLSRPARLSPTSAPRPRTPRSYNDDETAPADREASRPWGPPDARLGPCLVWHPRRRVVESAARLL